jgi:hypothetical protein
METTRSYRRITQPQRAETPLDLFWTSAAGPRALPRRTLHPYRRRKSARQVHEVDFDLAQYPGVRGEPLDFSQQVHRLCADIVSRCQPLHHIDMQRILVGVTQARTPRSHGLQAKITPLRFHQGALLRSRRGRHYQVQRCWLDGVEILYLMTFCLPRFLDQSFDEKFITLFHELYHIAPTFDGDLRRHEGRCTIHTHSQKAYDRQMAGLAREYLAGGADPQLHGFLRLNFQQLLDMHGTIHGLALPAPRLVPVE